MASTKPQAASDATTPDAPDDTQDTNQDTTAEAPLKRRATQNPVRLLAQHAVEAMLEKKAHDIVVMDMRRVSGVADFFVLGTGDSDLQIRAVAEAVRMRIREECGERPWQTEGTDHHQWVVMDYVDLVVHLFNPEKRGFYDLERLWGDAPREEVPNDGSADDVKLLQEGYEPPAAAQAAEPKPAAENDDTAAAPSGE